MRYRLDEPIFTRVLSASSELSPSDNSLYITGDSPETRSSHVSAWESQRPSVEVLRVQANNSALATATNSRGSLQFNLRSTSAIGSLFEQRKHASTYLDITGLPHHVWAPLLRAIRARPEPAFVVYVEPGDYRFSESPTETSLFDLSEKIEGISPLPGFLTLENRSDQDGLFVPLLGFEGARLAFMIEAVQPNRENIRPVIGVPGFRPEYPFHAYLGNRLQLLDTRAWQHVRFATANCPFSLYHLLGALAEEPSSTHLKVAMIGTKPHALGAVLYYLDHPTTTELLYDHPIRKERRTEGTSRVCVYDLSLLPPFRPERGVV